MGRDEVRMFSTALKTGFSNFKTEMVQHMNNAQMRLVMVFIFLVSFGRVDMLTWK